MALPAPTFAAAALAAFAAAGALAVVALREAPAPPDRVATAPASAAPRPLATPEAGADLDDGAAARAAQAQHSPGDAARAPASPAARPEAATQTAAPGAPRLDVVRVTPEGGALVAGRAAPGATVTLRTEDGTLAEVRADAAGDFVAVFEAPPASAPMTLTAVSAPPGGEALASPDVVVLLPAPQGPAPEAADAPAAAAPAAPAASAAAPRVAAAATRGDVEATPAGAAPGDLAPPASAGTEPAMVTVQPGASLWALARSHYGSGTRYVRIYAANRGLIGDPALIYPGQVLVLPSGETGE